MTAIQPDVAPPQMSQRQDGLTVTRLGFGQDAVDYATAWDLQRELHARIASGRGPNTVLLLEHPSVYTAGRRTEDFERPIDGTPVVDVDRGGKITWHGPGQLVGYPILALPDPLDVVSHVRRIEGMLIEVCAELGLSTTRVSGRSGVWVPADKRGPDRKIAAIGIRVSQRVTMHGFAINITRECLPPFFASSRVASRMPRSRRSAVSSTAMSPCLRSCPTSRPAYPCS